MRFFGFKSPLDALWRANRCESRKAGAELSSPLMGFVATTIAPYVHGQDSRANKHRTAHHNPLWQVRVHDSVENAQQKRPTLGFDACAGFKPRLQHCERARRPRNRLDDDGVDKRSDVQRS